MIYLILLNTGSLIYLYYGDVKMYRKTLTVIVLVAIMLFIFGCSPQSHSDGDGVSAGYSPGANTGELELTYRPVTKEDGSKFTIGFLDLDPYPLTGQMLYDVIVSLKADGWINYDSLPFDRDNIDSQKLIKYLSEQDLGPYLQFSKTLNYYFFVDYEDELNGLPEADGIDDEFERMLFALDNVLQRSADAKDVDILLAWSTSMASMASAYSDSMAVVAFITDAVGSGVVEGLEYSGVPNVWAHTDDQRYKRQMQVFKEVFDFGKMGVVYSDRRVAVIADYEEMAETLNVELAEKQMEQLDGGSAEDLEKYIKSFAGGVADLLTNDKIDAFLLTTDMIKSEEQLDSLISLCNEFNVPVFVQIGDEFVEKGALMTVQLLDSSVGNFIAHAIGKILNGVKPEEIMQYHLSMPYLSLNIDAARKLGVKVPFEMLMSSEKIYGGMR